MKIVCENQVIFHLNCAENARAYISTMKALKFCKDGPSVSFSDYEDNFVLMEDLTSTQKCNVQMYYPVVAASLRIEICLKDPVAKTLEFALFGERLSAFTINNTELVTKMDIEQIRKIFSNTSQLKFFWIFLI